MMNVETPSENADYRIKADDGGFLSRIHHPAFGGLHSPPRRRILLSANAVSPVRGSEPGVGWHICTRLAKYHDVTVLCTPGVPGKNPQDFRGEISDRLNRDGPIPGMTFEFVELPLPAFLFQRETALCRRTLYYTGYKAWQRKALAVATRLHQQQPFDLVHHLNITGYREPGYLWQLPIPFVWGPLGGAANFPQAYFDLLSGKDRLFYSLRNRANHRQQMSPRCLAAADKASHIWAISAEDAQMVQTRWHRPAQRMLETGATVRNDGRVRDYDGSRPLRLVWCGQHLGRKALPILLHALGDLRNKQAVELTVVGQGPQTARWRALAQSLGLKWIVWTGQVPHDRSLTELSRADVLVFTSVLEGTPHVVLEAMSLGLPVICHDACGMGVAVNDDSGIRLHMQDSATSIREFARAIERLVDDPAEVIRLSQGALQRAAELSWDRKVEEIAQTYENVFARSAV
jgi:glycosyltransferase involved in cell wall biosynthesis